MVKSILEEDKDIEECSFVGSASHDSSVFDAVEIIKLKLKILDGKSLDFKELRDKVEDIGVFVLSINQIRSHHTRIGTKIFRGFAIADNIAPFIIINPDDAKGAQSFTLIHELTHIFIGSSGISAQPNINFLQTPSGKIEKFCNDVASNFLLPTSLIETTEPITDCQEALDFIAPIANKRKISHLMVAYRLLCESIISEDTYNRLGKIYFQLWEKEKEKRKEKAKLTKGSPNPHLLKKQNLGKLFINFVERSLNAQELTYTKAANLLGVDAASVRVLIETRTNSNPK